MAHVAQEHNESHNADPCFCLIYRVNETKKFYSKAIFPDQKDSTPTNGIPINHGNR